MALKFTKPLTTKKKTPKQQIQWKLFAALGYTIAIRGYLNCWRGLIEAAMQESVDRYYAIKRIDEALNMSVWVEQDLRKNLRRIK